MTGLCLFFCFPCEAIVLLIFECASRANSGNWNEEASWWLPSFQTSRIPQSADKVTIFDWAVDIYSSAIASDVELSGSGTLLIHDFLEITGKIIKPLLHSKLHLICVLFLLGNCAYPYNNAACSSQLDRVEGNGVEDWFVASLWSIPRVPLPSDSCTLDDDVTVPVTKIAYSSDIHIYPESSLTVLGTVYVTGFCDCGGQTNWKTSTIGNFDTSTNWDLLYVPTLSNKIFADGVSEISLDRSIQLQSVELQDDAILLIGEDVVLLVEENCQGCDPECNPDGGTCSGFNTCICKPDWSGLLCETFGGNINQAVEELNSLPFSAGDW